MFNASPFPTAQLADVVDILDNLRVPINGAERMGRAGTVPYYGANGFQGWIDRPLFNEPLILLAEDGGNFDDFATRPIAYRIDGPAWVNNHAHIIRAKAGVCQSFIFWSIVNKDIRKYIAGGTRTKLTQGELRRIEINLPIEEEQNGIAEILDTLDTAIHETEAIIAKLNAVKQGLLHDLLTRGIDADGELRPTHAAAPNLYKKSPLGWIPNDWNVEPLSSCIASLDAGVSVNSEDRPHGADEIGVLKTSALSQGAFCPDQNKTVVANEVRLVREPVTADSILVSRMNTPQLVGESCYVAQSWPTLFLPDRIWQLKKTESDSVHMRWLSYVFLTSNYRAYIEVHATGTSGSMKNLSKSHLKAMSIAFPPINEQKLIADRLAKADEVITTEFMKSEKLKAEKSGLIYDLLTGNVRVKPFMSEYQLEQGDA
jgi:type I restriction enzyme S subunit